MAKKKILILGGGFAGVYTAMNLEKMLSKKEDIEIMLVNRENYFVYQPMLSEIVSGTLGALDTVSPLRRLLKNTTLYLRKIDQIDTEKKEVTLDPQFSHTPLVLSYDYLVLALGNVTDFKGARGLHEHAFSFKTLSDAISLRNHLIAVIEAAATEQDPILRKELLTFVIGGGGFAGCEVAASLNDFVRNLAGQYKTISVKEIRVVLVHSKERLLERELSPSLGRYSETILQKRGIELRLEQRLIRATPNSAIIQIGKKEESIFSQTVISTVPSSPNPLLGELPLPMEFGKVKTDSFLQVEGSDSVWAVGDCALIPRADPDKEGEFYPPTAQFAVREAEVVAKNIIASLRGGKKKPMTYNGLGVMGALGHRCAVGEIGKFKVSGLLAWIVWRAVYLFKLPGLDRKIKVAISWLLDTIVPDETVQLRLNEQEDTRELYFEKNSTVFKEGDLGDTLYIIASGSVGVYKGKKQIATLKKGELFGEIALISNQGRSATIKCLEQTKLIAISKRTFDLLSSGLPTVAKLARRAAKKRGFKLPKLAM